MHRTVHYEAAFEAFLRGRGIPYVAVDEAKKALFAKAPLKSFDFVVYSRTGPNLLIDVKGRSCRDRSNRKGFESWATEQDLEDLAQWEQVFGPGFSAVLAFVYWIDPPMLPDPHMFEFRDRWYLILGISLPEYRDHMRRRSEKWKTVCLKTQDFQSLARPIDHWLSSGDAVVPSLVPSATPSLVPVLGSPLSHAGAEFRPRSG
jgi:hypothetical protein